jgi:hypothetical protein
MAPPEVTEIRARGIVRGVAAGPALVSGEGISFLGDLDIKTGEVVNRTHSLAGQSVAGRVLVLPHSVGSAGAWRFLYQLFVHRTQPLAIVQLALPDSSLVQGAILAGIRTGDHVEVDGTAGVVRVTRADAAENAADGA